MDSRILLATLLLSLFASGYGAKPEQWAKAYYVEGFLRLPYAELSEPIKGWYEEGKNRSRVNYYDSVSTYQTGASNENAYGQLMKVVPMTTEEFLNVQTCFLVNGTESEPIIPQILLPDLSDLEESGTEVLEGEKCTVFQKVEKILNKINTYKFYLSIRTKLPVRYEMMGYDSLLHSHYDRYYVDYVKYMPVKGFSDRIFTPPQGLKCRDFPGPGAHTVTMNPLSEYIHHDTSYVEEEFSSYKKRHGKDYKDKTEHSIRKKHFKNNLRYINSKNRQGLSYTLAINHLADRSDAELSYLSGSKRSPVKGNGGLPYDQSQHNFEIPPAFDWRLYGAVTPVKDQATCGSCWTYGTTGCVEGAYFLKTNQLVKFSQQELVDCSWGEENNGCDGGEDWRAYQWIMKHGLAKEEDYPYLGQDGYCKMKTVEPAVFIKGYVNVTSGDIEAAKKSMVKHGPLSVSIDVTKGFSFYSNGVYYDPECGNTVDDLRHTVLAVGYGTLNGEDYWLIKNSWSTYWGNDGYILISQKNNNCGVATAATYVVM